MILEVVGTGSKGNCYLFKSDGQTLIVELGIRWDIVKRALNFDLSNVVGCLVTHEHNDHSRAMPDAAISGINIYATAGTFSSKGLVGHRYHNIEKNKLFQIGEFKVLPFKVMHDASDPVGFIINHPGSGNILFITDSYYVPNTFENINNIIVEANYCEQIINDRLLAENKFLRDRVIQSHMSLQTCKSFLRANDLSNVNNIVLIHLSAGNSDAGRFQKEISHLTGKTVTVANTGIKIDLSLTPF